jgi:rhodanese-related sulfurtransferase
MILRQSVIFEILFILILSVLSAIINNTISANGIPLFYHEITVAPDQQLSLSQTELVIWEKRALIIDARAPEEYSTGHLPGAINVPGYAAVDQILEAVKTIPKDRMIVTYCSGVSCPYADRLSGFLRFQGYRAVYVFPGGIDAWKAAGNQLNGEK